MKKILSTIAAICFLTTAAADSVPFGNGQLSFTPIARNAVRIQYQEGEVKQELPEWIYVNNTPVKDADVKVEVDQQQKKVSVKDVSGRVVFTATQHQLCNGKATLAFCSPQDEYQFGLGQFQDGYSNVRGLSRRLTQVNTQISIPMLLSSKGYGILWNNYGMTEFNPADQCVTLKKKDGAGEKDEVRERHIFEGTISIAEEGDYSLLLDVGQKMARRHNLCIDGETVIEMQNLWLPPTASQIVHLKAGQHQLSAELTKDDQPTLYYQKVNDETVFSSPVAACVDYTVFTGTPDEIIATYRELTGKAPKMPTWALGYIHCRERFHSSDEILSTANRFNSRKKVCPSV